MAASASNKQLTSPMQKTYSLHVEGKHPERLLEAIKHEINKYLQRERRRKLPSGADFWDFDCRFGPVASDATVIKTSEIKSHINTLVAAGGTQFYIEVLAKPGVRSPRPERAEDTPSDVLGDALDGDSSAD